MLLGNGHFRRAFGISPAVKYLLVGAVAPDVGQETVKVLLQLGIVGPEAGTYRNRCQPGAYRVDLCCYLLAEYQRQAFAALHINLAGL